MTLALQQYLQGYTDLRRSGKPRSGERGSASGSFDTLLLGCTHFPVFRDALREVLDETENPGVALVDSAETTARALADQLSFRESGGRVCGHRAHAGADGH